MRSLCLLPAEDAALRACGSEPEADLQRQGEGIVALAPYRRSSFTGISSSTKKVLKECLLAGLVASSYPRY